MHSEGNIFNICGVCFNITYSMTNQSLSDAMFPEKSVANAAMKSNFAIQTKKTHENMSIFFVS